MNAWIARIAAGVLAAAGAGSAAGAQAPPVPPAEEAPGAGAVSLDALLGEGTSALLAQVRVLTAPRQGEEVEPADLPCAEQPVDRVTRVVSERPVGLLSRAAWEVWAWRALRRLGQPLPVCFPAGRVRPDRMFENVITFNSDWMSSSRAGGGQYLLRGFAGVREDTALARQRAAWVKGKTDANVRSRLTPDSGGRSREIGVARWVQYQLRSRR